MILPSAWQTITPPFPFPMAKVLVKYQSADTKTDQGDDQILAVGAHQQGEQDRCGKRHDKAVIYQEQQRSA